MLQCCLAGVLVSERDKLLTSKYFARVCDWLGIDQRTSDASHPQMNSQPECADTALEDVDAVLLGCLQGKLKREHELAEGQTWFST